MIYLCYAFCFVMAACIINIYCKKFYRKTAKKLLGKGKLVLYIFLLGSFLCWAGTKPEQPDEPDEPDEPDTPSYETVEGIRLKLIGKVNEDGKFVPLTSEWIQTNATNIVDALEEIQQ